jgi:hypothetical protein
MTNTKTLSDDTLQKAYVIIAGIVTEHGEKYLPIFKRLHEEVEVRKAQRDLLAIAIKTACSENTTYDFDDMLQK